MKKLKEPSPHGLQEKLLGAANFVTILVPFFGLVGMGCAGDIIDRIRKKVTAVR